MTTALVFYKNKSAEQAARLHAASCPVVAAARASRSANVVTDDVEFEVEDLNERGFPVKRCKCLKEGAGT